MRFGTQLARGAALCSAADRHSANDCATDSCATNHSAAAKRSVGGRRGRDQTTTTWAIIAPAPPLEPIELPDDFDDDDFDDEFDDDFEEDFDDDELEEEVTDDDLEDDDDEPDDAEFDDD